MGKGSRSIDSVQDNALNGFSKAIRADKYSQEDNSSVAMAIRDGKRKGAFIEEEETVRFTPLSAAFYGKGFVAPTK